MDNFFITALGRAGSCQYHAKRRRSHSAIRQMRLQTSRRTYHAAVVPRESAGLSDLAVPREDYIGLLDYYDEPPIPDKPLPDSSRIASPLVLVSSPHEVESRARPDGRPARSQAEQEHVDRLEKALDTTDVENESLYRLYKALPSPGVSSLSRSTISALLRRMSKVQRKNEVSMLRYLSLIDDMKAAGLPMKVSEWTSAMSFAGRCFGHVTGSEVESALYLFKEMELDAGIKGNYATFSVLFDLAAKAGKFVLAEMILNEMERRRIYFDRFARVGLIYFYGLKGDGDGVRHAYRDLVHAGEIVDTVVLNCVIAALLRAGEAPAAQHVYERMKHLHARRFGGPLPPLEWQHKRGLGRALSKAAGLASTHPLEHRVLQSTSNVAPDLQTYGLLIAHHAEKAGHFEQIGPLIYDMHFYKLALHGSIFLSLMKGFATHGNRKGSTWNESNLEAVWAGYLEALDNKVAELYVGKYLVMWALKAFAKCVGKERTMEVWDEVQRRWKPQDGELAIINDVLRGILADSSDTTS